MYSLPLPKSQKILFGAFLFGLVVITTSFLSQLPLSDSSIQFTGKGDRERLSSGKAIAQIFTTNQNNLTLVKYHLGNLHLWPGEHLLFELRDAECQTVLREVTRRPLLLTPPIYTRFEFERISDSENQTYCAVLIYESPYKQRSSNLPFVHTNETPGMQYFFPGKDKVVEDHQLEFKPGFATGNTWQDFWALIERMSQYKPDWIKGWSLVLLMAFTLGSSLLLGLLIIFIQESSVDSEE